jgi:hypothetical protein
VRKVETVVRRSVVKRALESVESAASLVITQERAQMLQILIVHQILSRRNVFRLVLVELFAFEVRRVGKVRRSIVCGARP